MKCPKCGYMRQTRDDAFVPATECPSCGIVYSKHGDIAAPMRPGLSTAQPPHLRPSAVDPESLKKARERVEKRLRERIDVRTRDDRYEQTLELAKKITNDSIHNDRDPVLRALEKKMANTPVDPIDEAAIETEDPVLLEEMVGVQIHSGKENDASQDEDEKTEPVDHTPAESATDISADSEPAPVEAQPDTAKTAAKETETVTEEQDDLEAEVAETVTSDAEPAVLKSEPSELETTEVAIETAEVQSPPKEHHAKADTGYPDDVRVETVVLTSQLETSGAPLQEDSETEPPAAETASYTDDIELPSAYIAEASNATRFGANLTRLLPMVAWLILVTGLVGAVLSWTTISEVEAGVSVPVSDGQGTGLPLGLLLGFAYLATGALGFAFFWVSSMINRQLKDIRQILMVHPGAGGPDALSGDMTEWTDSQTETVR